MLPAAESRRALRVWAREHRRPLPWRGERDPYRVLVSEVMLQQTQAARVAEAYPRFLERFPTIEALARSGADEVLREWGRLGYNRRALNLWRAARECLERGGVPDTVEGLEALAGVGPYTARAVAAFAFGRPVAAVDANVRRILTRVAGRPPDEDVQPEGDRLVDPKAPGAWNQTMMDLGASVCRPRGPRCDTCPLSRWCAWCAGTRPQARRSPERPREPFVRTSRYARGRVVEALRASEDGLHPDRLAERTGLASDRAADAVRSLERDGVVSRRDGVLVLGPDG